ncbi:MAG: hypothetical protein V2A74_05265 [bacterium]
MRETEFHNRGRGTVALLALGLWTMAALHARASSDDQSLRGTFALGKDIPVKLEWGTAEHPQMFLVNSIRFKKVHEILTKHETVLIRADLTVWCMSWPKTTWEVIVEFLKDGDESVGQARAILDNGGMILSGQTIMFGPHTMELAIPVYEYNISKMKEFSIRLKVLPQSEVKGGAGDTVQPAEIPQGATVVGYVDDTAEGQRSLGASGHAVAFDRPATARFVEAVQIFAGRYGQPEAPKEDFHLYLLNEKRQVMADLRYPYGMIERGDLKWYTLRTPSIEVPEEFFVSLSFNPHQTKGIYLGTDESVAQSHSFAGLPDSGFEEVKEKRDWMVRLHLAQEPSGEKGIQRLADWKPPVTSDPFEGCIEAKYDAGPSEEKQSYGGRGPAIQFRVKDFLPSGTPSEKASLKGFRLYASRYGSGYDPEKTMVKVALLDSSNKVRWEGGFPYRSFSYKAQWVDFALPQPIALSELVGDDGLLTVAFDPEAHQTKGIYFHYNKNPQTSHSMAGTTAKGFTAVPDREWIIRSYLATR